MAAYSTGQLKVFVGCRRFATRAVNPNSEGQAFPGGGGGEIPGHKNLLRECDYEETQDSIVVAVALSEALNLICTVCKNGVVRVVSE